METPAEEYEHIPWSALIRDDEIHRRRFLWYGAAGVLVLVVIVLAVVRMAGDSDPSDLIAPVPLETSTTSAAASENLSQQEVAHAPAVSEPVLFTEADLMASVSVDDQTRAALVAEWFVTDYFTVDGDETTRLAVRSALPPGTEHLTIGQDQLGGSSYVEWASAFHSTVRLDGAYDVSVAFRTVAAAGNDAFRRLPVRAVNVTVSFDPYGVAAVNDLPEPIEAPSRGFGYPVPRPGAASPPSEVTNAALQRAAEWGEEPRILEAATDQDRWRVVLSVVDPSGLRWPLIVYVDAASTAPTTDPVRP